MGGKGKSFIVAYAYDGLEVIDGKLYFAGGYDGYGQYHNTFERYDPDSNQWTVLASMSVARAGLSTSVLNGKFHAIQGLTLVLRRTQLKFLILLQIHGLRASH